MNQFSIIKIALPFILILAAGLRLWNIGSVPPSVSLDEASISYNAYSIIKTGGDEYGEFPIISHRAYDDWRRAMHLYLVIPFISLLGMNTVSVRLPAVILSFLTVLAVYKITLLLFSKKSTLSTPIALMTAFLLTISPWHIYLSRIGHESNSFFSFFIFGILFILRVKKGIVDIIIAMVFFLLSAISYPSGQIIAPLFIAGIFFLFRKKILIKIPLRQKAILLFALIVLIIPIGRGVFSEESLLRYKGTSIFTTQPQLTTEYAVKRAEAIEKGKFFEVILYNRRVLMFRQAAEGYFSHYNPSWLFSNSFYEPHKVPKMGLLYIWQAPFIIIGVIVLLFSKLLDLRVKGLIILWFFLSPLPGSIATQFPHAMRSYSAVVVWQIFTAFGLVYFYYWLPKLRRVMMCLFIFIIGVSLHLFYKNYFITFPQEQSKSFQYALSQAIPYVLSQEDQYKKIVFSNTENMYQSYMLFLYHSNYDPLRYQNLGGTKSGGYEQSHSFDKYEFRHVEPQNEKIEKGTLYVLNPSEVMGNKRPIKTFMHLDGTEAIKIIKE